ncbi:hypothetical protein [Limnospira platensis]
MKKAGIGIPTIQDRARQALVKSALEPEWESRPDGQPKTQLVESILP